jgi:hypothetical protein
VLTEGNCAHLPHLKPYPKLTGCNPGKPNSIPYNTMSSFTSTTNNNKCRKFCCLPAREPDTIPLGVRLKNLNQVGLTGPARYQRTRPPMRGLPGIDLDRKDVYVNVSNAAKREWYDDEDGWQRVVRKVRPVRPWMGTNGSETTNSPSLPEYSEYLEQTEWNGPQGKWV